MNEVLDYLTHKSSLPEVIIIDALFLNQDAHHIFIQLKSSGKYKKIITAAAVFNERDISKFSNSDFPIDHFFLKGSSITPEYLRSLPEMAKPFV